jgi:hypothetical protein
MGKLRKAKSDEDKADVAAELEAAYRLLADSSISLTYEPNQKSGTHTDFRATSFGRNFHVEVKRIREPEDAIAACAAASNQGGFIRWAIPYTQKESFKFSDHLTGCLGQLCADVGNVLVIKIDSTTHEPIELCGAIYQLLNGELPESYFRDKGFSGRSDFLGRWRLLSAAVVLTRWETVEGDRANVSWCNESAAYPLPDGILKHLKSM